MAAVIADKYHLKSIHEEIALFDRKLAHLMKFEKFETDEQRDQAARKLNLKRNNLVQTAQRLAAEGVEFKRSDLPASLRPADAPGDVLEPKKEAVVEQADPTPQLSTTDRQSSFARGGASLDWQKSVREYLDKKHKS